MSTPLTKMERQRNFDLVKDGPSMSAAEKENVQALIDSLPEDQPCWSRQLPSSLPGLYWMRNHKGKAAITYLDRWLDSWTLDGARTQLTEDYRATQDTEFWTEKVTPPPASTAPGPLTPYLEILHARFKLMQNLREQVANDYSERGEHRTSGQLSQTASAYGHYCDELERVMKGEMPPLPGHAWEAIPEPTAQKEEPQPAKDQCDFCRGKDVRIYPNGLCALCLEPETTEEES